MKISVVIPCHNVGSYIGACLESVLQQEYRDLEVLVVDDGSTDGTVAVVEEVFKSMDIEHQLLEQDNRGASSARNAGWRKATGTYVQFLDADDTLLPTKLRSQVELIHSNDHPDLIVGDYVNAYPEGGSKVVDAEYEAAWVGLIKTRLGTTSANLWKRDALEKVGGWDEHSGSSQDYELMFRMLCNGAAVAYDPVPRTQVLKRRSGSISRTDVKQNWMRYIALRKRIRDHLKKADPKGYSTELATLDQYLFMAIHLLAQEDLDLAVDLYRSEIPTGFVPVPGPAITRSYVAAHRLLGFERAVRLRKRIPF